MVSFNGRRLVRSKPFPTRGDNFETVGKIAKPTDTPARIVSLLIETESGWDRHDLARTLGISAQLAIRNLEALKAVGIVDETETNEVGRKWVLGNRPSLALSLRLGQAGMHDPPRGVSA